MEDGSVSMEREQLGQMASRQITFIDHLEKALMPTSRLGGHIVQGHVDGVAKVSKISADSQWTRMDIAIPKDLMRYVVAQGSICVEGVSLTVGELNDQTDQISVWLIPETLANTNLSVKAPGDLLNIEVDVLAKYVERLIARGQDQK
jgi:riboflavin synthase